MKTATLTIHFEFYDHLNEQGSLKELVNNVADALTRQINEGNLAPHETMTRKFTILTHKGGPTYKYNPYL